MRLTCHKSGIPFSCDFFPATIPPYNQSHVKIQHPVFSIPQKSLLQYAHKWSTGGFNETDLYLYYLALLDSTDLIEWRTSAKVSEHTMSTIAQNIESLIRCIGRINLVSHPSFKLHHIVIHSETANLYNSPHWINNWNNSYNSFCEGYKEEIQHDRIAARERQITKLINDKSKPISYYAKSLATWAEMAAEFPTYLVRINDKPTPINEYWKDIIVRCTNDDKIFQIPENHIAKLLDHCEESLDVIGSPLGYTLLRLIRDGLHRQKTYLGFDDLDGFSDSNPGFKLITQHTSIEQAAITALIEAAPKELPVRENYSTLVAYLKAKTKYDEAQKYIQQQALIIKLEENMSDNLKDLDLTEPSMQDAIEDEIILPSDINIQNEESEGEDDETI